MSAIAATDKLFFERADAALDQATAAQIVDKALHGSDDGELFLEYRESESISLDDGNIRSANFDSGLGCAASGKCAGMFTGRPATGFSTGYPQNRLKAAWSVKFSLLYEIHQIATVTT